MVHLSHIEGFTKLWCQLFRIWQINNKETNKWYSPKKKWHTFRMYGNIDRKIGILSLYITTRCLYFFLLTHPFNPSHQKKFTYIQKVCKLFWWEGLLSHKLSTRSLSFVVLTNPYSTFHHKRLQIFSVNITFPILNTRNPSLLQPTHIFSLYNMKHLHTFCWNSTLMKCLPSPSSYNSKARSAV